MLKLYRNEYFVNYTQIDELWCCVVELWLNSWLWVVVVVVWWCSHKFMLWVLISWVAVDCDDFKWMWSLNKLRCFFLTFSLPPNLKWNLVLIGAELALGINMKVVGMDVTFLIALVWRQNNIYNLSYGQIATRRSLWIFIKFQHNFFYEPWNILKINIRFNEVFRVNNWVCIYGYGNMICLVSLWNS